jgi:hypothetical protein
VVKTTAGVLFLLHVMLSSEWVALKLMAITITAIPNIYRLFENLRFE